MVVLPEPRKPVTIVMGMGAMVAVVVTVGGLRVASCFGRPRSGGVALVLVP